MTFKQPSPIFITTVYVFWIACTCFFASLIRWTPWLKFSYTVVQRVSDMCHPWESNPCLHGRETLIRQSTQYIHATPVYNHRERVKQDVYKEKRKEKNEKKEKQKARPLWSAIELELFTLSVFFYVLLNPLWECQMGSEPSTEWG